MLTKKKPHREVGSSRRRRGKIQALRVAGKTIRHPDGKHCNVATYGNVYHIGAHSCVVERVTSISQWTGIQITVHQLGVDVRYALLRANGAKGCFAPSFRSLDQPPTAPESGRSQRTLSDFSFWCLPSGLWVSQWDGKLRLVEYEAIPPPTSSPRHHERGL